MMRRNFQQPVFAEAVEGSTEEEEEEERKVITLRSRRLPPAHNNHHTRSTTRSTTTKNDRWKKEGPSMQDRINIDPQKISEKLIDFERIPLEKYKTIETGTFIRYLSYRNEKAEPKLRLGGYLIKNGYPDYWVLKSGGRGRRPITWSVPLKGNPDKGIPANDYFMKRGILHSRDERVRYGMEVFDALNSGRYMLINTDELEGLTGQLIPGAKGRTTKKRTFEMDDEEGEESSFEEEPQQRLRARFRDNSSEEYY